MRTESVLINELHLGSRLNQAVESNRRGEFGLLLAMLSTDPRDMAQFRLQQSRTEAERLQRAFELLEPAPLLADLSNDSWVTDNSACFFDEGARSFQLHQAMTPEALVIRGAMPSDLSQALTNTDPAGRLRHCGESAQLPELPPLAEILTTQRNFSRKLAGLT
ncbi:MAG: queD-like protein [Shewanella sp.]|nr:queD-like protein [Shewanella sp.]MCF1430937.1 queD-like protein [Shewanella sp.]MCF1457079.1 queD-like protein [Shewanella sp.]